MKSMRPTVGSLRVSGEQTGALSAAVASVRGAHRAGERVCVGVRTDHSERQPGGSGGCGIACEAMANTFL